MIRYLYGGELSAFPKLRDTMFRHRAAQFRDRLGWDVTVDGQGWERDEYDALNPLYVVWEAPDGRHGGSMRFLPTTGATMINDHFPQLTGGARIASPLIWECTRFCLGPNAAPRVSAALMLGGLELGLRHGLSHAVGVFDARMVRVYRALGWSPEILGAQDGVAAGLWAFRPALRDGLLRKAGVSADLSAHWLRRAFGGPRRLAG